MNFDKRIHQYSLNFYQDIEYYPHSRNFSPVPFQLIPVHLPFHPEVTTGLVLPVLELHISFKWNDTVCFVKCKASFT